MNNRVNRVNFEDIRFFKEQLFEAKQALFMETSVKRIKFLQNKIKYLQERVKELERI